MSLSSSTKSTKSWADEDDEDLNPSTVLLGTPGVSGKLSEKKEGSVGSDGPEDFGWTEVVRTGGTTGTNKVGKTAGESGGYKVGNITGGTEESGESGGAKITLEKIVATVEQKDKMEEVGAQKWDDFYTITFGAANVDNIKAIDYDDDDTTIIHNVWIASRVPDHVTFDDVYKSLRRFVTNPDATGRFNVSGRLQNVKYPYINVKSGNGNGKTFYVTFNPDSNDGIFANHMCKQLKIETSKGPVVLRFSHFRKRN
jgi:hypothetical protein